MIHVATHMSPSQCSRHRLDESDPSSIDEWASRHVPEIDAGQATWIDIERPTAAELAWLGRKFNFHPLALEDCAHFDQRAKVEDYINHLFVVIHALKTSSDGEVGVSELHCFQVKNLVVTVHEEPIPALQSLMERAERDASQLPTQGDFLFHRVLDRVMDDNPRHLDRIEEVIAVLDEEVSRQIRPEHLEAIQSVRRQLASIRRVLGPQREIYYGFSKGTYAGISPQAYVYFRDIYDHAIRIFETVDELREAAAAIQDAYLAGSSFRTNETMKRLTVFNALFLPLTFITGFFGMNFTHIPFDDKTFFYLSLAMVLLLPIVLIFWFRRKHWLD